MASDHFVAAATRRALGKGQGSVFPMHLILGRSSIACRRTCTAANRFYAEAGVADEFTAKLAEAMGAVKVGSGFEPDVSCGLMINQAAIADIDSLIKQAVAAGASATLGGLSPVDGPVFFL